MDQPITAPLGATPIMCDMTGAPDTPEQRVAEYGRLFAQYLLGRERRSPRSGLST